MGIFINANGGTTAYLRRAASHGFNSTYTITFSMYVPSQASFADDQIYGCSGATGITSQSIGTRRDTFGGSSSSFFKMGASSTTSTVAYANTTQKPNSAEWCQIAIRRTSATSLTVRTRVGGTVSNLGGTSNDVTSREAGAYEGFFWDSAVPTGAASGTGIMNFKAWSVSLTDAQIDAEWQSTNVINATGLHSSCPMSSTTTHANNVNDQSGGTVPFGSSWNSGANCIAGANDPYVALGGPWSLTQSGTAPVLGAIQVAGNLGITQSRWRIPLGISNPALLGAPVWVQVFNGTRSTPYTIAAQGVAVIAYDSVGADYYVTIPGSGTVGATALAVVHDYNDVPTVSSIAGGPGIATSILG